MEFKNESPTPIAFKTNYNTSELSQFTCVIIGHISTVTHLSHRKALKHLPVPTQAFKKVIQALKHPWPLTL